MKNDPKTALKRPKTIEFRNPGPATWPRNENSRTNSLDKMAATTLPPLSRLSLHDRFELARALAREEIAQRIAQQQRQQKETEKGEEKGEEKGGEKGEEKGEEKEKGGVERGTAGRGRDDDAQENTRARSKDGRREEGLETVEAVKAAEDAVAATVAWCWRAENEGAEAGVDVDAVRAMVAAELVGVTDALFRRVLADVVDEVERTVSGRSTEMTPLW